MGHALTWKRFLLGLSLLGLVFAVTSWIVEGVTPSWVVFPILLAVGLIRARRGGTSGIVLLGLAALVFLLVHIPFVRRRFPTTAPILWTPTKRAIASSGSSLSASFLS